MSNCIIKADESVEPSDSRLSDTACVIESGVIIRPPPDLTLADKSQPAKLAPIKPKFVKPAMPSLLPQFVAPVSQVKVIDKQPEVVATPGATVAHTMVSSSPPAEAVEQPDIFNPTTTMIAVGAVVAVAGTAVAGTAMGGFSTLQTKLATVFGTSKGAVATAAVVTAGTIVAVKALEKKMNSLETDLEKTRKEVGEASSSIDKIDALLDRLGS